MRDLYLIDGYNVIFWLPHEFDRNDLESSRKKLIDLMQDYGHIIMWKSLLSLTDKAGR